MSDFAIIGPPWRRASMAEAKVALAADPPALVSEHAWAVWSPALKRLFRSEGKRTAFIRAHLVAAKGDGRAFVFKGGVQTRGGAWIFPTAVQEVVVDKALDPRAIRDFQVLVEQARDRLVTAASGPEASALRAMLPAVSEAAWAELSVAEAGAIVDAIGADLMGIAANPRFVASVERVLGAASTSVADTAKRGVTIRGATGSGLSLRDRQLARNIGTRSGLFVTDEYGRRSARWNDLATRAVARGAEVGLDSRTIARDLVGILGNQVSGRTEQYFQVVASAAVSRARSFGEMRGYQDAGIEYYQWEAVMDGRTTIICETLHGQIFPVADSVARFAEADRARTPQAAVDRFPWYSFSGGTVYAGQPGGERVPMAVVTERGREPGTSSFSFLRSPQESGGSPVPPAHALCRSATLPVV